MNFAANGLLMLVVDASVLYESLTSGPLAPQVRAILGDHPDQAAPDLIVVEVLGLLRRDSMRRIVDETSARLAMTDIQEWPGELFPPTPFTERVWELRKTVRTWDAHYVALAEALRCPLVTMDQRLARAAGPQCTFIVIA